MVDFIEANNIRDPVSLAIEVVTVPRLPYCESVMMFDARWTRVASLYLFYSTLIRPSILCALIIPLPFFLIRACDRQ